MVIMASILLGAGNIGLLQELGTAPLGHPLVPSDESEPQSARPPSLFQLICNTNVRQSETRAHDRYLRPTCSIQPIVHCNQQLQERLQVLELQERVLLLAEMIN